MSEIAKERTRLRRLLKWLKDQLVKDVPENLVVCQFDCRTLECSEGEWETCERRLQPPARPPANRKVTEGEGEP